MRREEIELTEEELGRGGWGEVKVAKFRGLTVAAKFLYREILSDYNRQQFSREMTIAAKIRHPNLLLFIGATREGRVIHPHRAYAYHLAQGTGKKNFIPTADFLHCPRCSLCSALFTPVEPPLRSSIVTSAVPMCYWNPSLMAGGQRSVIIALLSL